MFADNPGLKFFKILTFEAKHLYSGCSDCHLVTLLLLLPLLLQQPGSLILLAVHHSLVVEEHGGMVAMVVEEQQPTCVRHWTQPVTGAPRLERRCNRY